MNRTPTKRWLALAAVLALACLAAASSLTKDDVIRMAKTGQSEQVILDAIHESHATFDLTANDIADLRQAGVSEKVIDMMTQRGSSQPKGKAGGTQEAQSGESSAEQSAEGKIQEPSPPPVAYPIYPLYYPVYYPVFNPFFPFFGGFFFSFEFIHVSRLFTVFPFSRTVIVLTSPFVLRGTSVVTSNPIVFSTPRTLPRGSTVGSPSGRVT